MINYSRVRSTYFIPFPLLNVDYKFCKAFKGEILIIIIKKDRLSAQHIFVQEPDIS